MTDNDSSGNVPIYRHSGKFGVQGPAAALGIAIILGLVAGLAYAYFIAWVPFIYINVLVTGAYGALFGFATCYLLYHAKVRNKTITLFTSLAAGLVACYGAWSGYVHVVLENPPWIATPPIIAYVMETLYQQGSWGMSSGSPVTGVPLAVVWLVEAGIIVGISIYIPYVKIANTPFCEKNLCWLDKEEIIPTLQPFTDPGDVKELRKGNLRPLTRAQPKDPASSVFARLTLKSSPASDEFCTLRIANIQLKATKEGVKENVKDLTGDLVLPRYMLELMSKFRDFGNPPALTEAPEEPSGEKEQEA